MKNLVKYNFRNYLHTWILFSGALILIVCAYFLLTGYQQSRINYDIQAQSEYHNKLEMMQNTVSIYLAENQELDETQRNLIQENISDQESILREMISARGNDDWKSELYYAILQGEEEIRLADLGVIDHDPTVESRVSFNRYLLDQGIRPKIPPNMCDGLNALKMYFEWMAFLVFSVCPLLFSVVLISAEQQHGEIKFLLQQPVSRRRILSSKYIVVFIQSFITALLIELSLFVSCSVLLGVGSLQYPLQLANGTYLSTGLFLLYGHLSAVCSILFFSALGILIAVSIRNEAIGVVCSVFIPVTLLMLQNWSRGNIYLIPVLSANIYNLVTQISVSVLYAFLIQIACTAGLLILADFIFNKKDMA